MPPKSATAADQDNGNSILILCQLMSTCTEFKADTAALAPVLGIAQAKNVPRKINSIIGPHGYELRTGKIVNKDEVDSIPSTPATDSTKKVTGIKKTPTTPSKSAKKNITPKNPASKKRKLDNDDASDDGNGTKDENESDQDNGSAEDKV